jgi:diacylglycerol O-acyltransferase
MSTLTGAEALMWTLDEEPSLRSSFMSITFVDRPPDQVRFRRRMLDAVDGVAVLKQRIVSAPLDLAPPRWEPDPDFDLDRHVRWIALPPPGGRRQLLDLAGSIYADPFDRARPLWRFTIVEGLEDGGCALLAKMHHVLSDGIGAVRVSASFLDLSPDGDEARPARAPADQATSSAGWFAAAAAALGPIVGAGLSAVRSPVGSVTQGLSTARSLARQLGLSDPARSPLWADRSFDNRFDVLSLDLDRVRAAARALGGTVNDAFVTIMAGAAGAYHRELGVDVDELRMSMPISVRHDKEVGGNAWVPARVLVPAGPLTPAERFGEVSARLTTVKKEPGFGMADTFAEVARHLPRPVLLRFARQQVRTVDFACSNVRGAPFDLWIAGAHVEANHPMGPTAGVAFNATVLSYRGTLDLGLNSDTGAITEPDMLRACIEDAARELLALA